MVDGVNPFKLIYPVGVEHCVGFKLSLIVMIGVGLITTLTESAGDLQL